MPLSEFPHQAYVAVGLHHLLQWVDKGTAPPRAERIARDNDEQNDGSRMTLDEHGNPRGGIRTPVRRRAGREVRSSSAGRRRR